MGIFAWFVNSFGRFPHLELLGRMSEHMSSVLFVAEVI